MEKKKAIRIAAISILILLASQAIYLLLPAAEKSGAENQQPNVKGATAENNQTEFNSDELYLLINAYRKDNKLSPLRIDSRLEQSAQSKLHDMVSQKYYRHSDPANQQSWYLFNSAGYDYKKAGENLSMSNNTPWKVFQAWMESASHNEQMLNKEYEDMGIAVECNNFEDLGSTNCLAVLHLGLE